MSISPGVCAKEHKAPSAPPSHGNRKNGSTAVAKDITSYNFTPANWVQDANGHTCVKPAVGFTLWQTAHNQPELWLPFSAVAKWKTALTNQQDKPVLPCGHYDVTRGV